MTPQEAVRKLSLIRQAIESEKQQAEQLKGRLLEIQRRLVEETGSSDPAKVESYLNTLRTKAEALEASVTKELERLEGVYGRRA